LKARMIAARGIMRAGPIKYHFRNRQACRAEDMVNSLMV
jgi:hypothetical protein